MKKDNKYILKKHSSGFFYILRNGPMTNVQPMTKSLLSQSGSHSSSCEAEKEEKRSLERQNLVCELEHASCEKMRALGVELLKQSVPVIEALEERFALLANG